MKRYFSLLMGVLGFVPILAQQSDYYYYYKGNRIDLTVDSTRLYVVSEGEFQPQISSYTRTVEYTVSNTTKSYVYNHVEPIQQRRSAVPDIYFSTLEIPEVLSATQYEALVEKVKAEESVWQVLPSFIKDGIRVEITNNFYVKLKSFEDFEQLEQMASRYNVEIIGNHKQMPLWYVLSCNAESTLDALAVANQFYLSDLFVFSSPEIYTGITLHSIDPKYPFQWNLNNEGDEVGFPNMDINVEEAWEITKGNNSVVAVFDEAIYTSHPDIVDNIYTGNYDIMTGGVPVFDPLTNMNHGNGCAGVIAAVQNNEIGLSGVAPESNIMSIAFSKKVNNATGLQISLGFTKAVEKKADVINCAWDYNGGRQEIIDEAIDYALNMGRNRKGCVIVFAAGNYKNNSDGSVRTDLGYPADSNPRILTVGGITPYGEHLTQGYMQNGHYVFESSKFSEELDVVAPAVLVYTINYPNGTTPSSDYYYGDFSGSSAACAHVSGIAALMLSVHPDLTVDQITSIIEYTARKVRTDLYAYNTDSLHTSGTWNEKVGYGLVDAGEAARIAYEASRTTYFINTTIDGGYEDYDFEFENAIIEPSATVEIIKEHNAVIRKSMYIMRGGEFYIY